MRPKLYKSAEKPFGTLALWMYFLISILTIMLPTHQIIAQSDTLMVDRQNQLSFTFDVSRRKSENYRLPNAFVRFENPNKICLNTNIRFLEGYNARLELNAKNTCTSYYSMGRNHIPSTLLSYWSHHSPKLYDLEVNLSDSTGLIFSKTIPVGIVDYRYAKENLYINNETHTMRSVSIVEKIDSAMLISLKKHHVNTILCNYLPEDVILDLTDKIGLYVLIDLRETYFDPATDFTLVPFQNHASIASIVVDETTKSRMNNKGYSNLPVLTSLPKNMINVGIENLDMASLRNTYQPFEVAQDHDCDGEQNFHKYKVANTEPFQHWQATRTVFQFQVSTIALDTTMIVTAKERPEVSLALPCMPDFNFKYHITVLADSTFSVFQKNDTVAYFTNTLNR